LAEFQMARQKAILFTNYSFFLVDMGMIATLPHIKESMLEQELEAFRTWRIRIPSNLTAIAGSENVSTKL